MSSHYLPFCRLPAAVLPTKNAVSFILNNSFNIHFASANNAPLYLHTPLLVRHTCMTSDCAALLVLCTSRAVSPVPCISLQRAHFHRQSLHTASPSLALKMAFSSPVPAHLLFFFSSPVAAHRLSVAGIKNGIFIASRCAPPLRCCATALPPLHDCSSTTMLPSQLATSLGSSSHQLSRQLTDAFFATR